MLMIVLVLVFTLNALDHDHASSVAAPLWDA
jgi:hypothetical protein